MYTKEDVAKTIDNAVLKQTYTKKDLIEKIKLVFEMDQEKIIQMKENVISYYENYYNPLNFINNIISNEDYYTKIIIIAVGEKFYKSYLPKINKNSIIIQ